MGLEAPSRRGNDGHVYKRIQTTPLGRTLRSVAEKVLHERVTKPKTGKGSGYKKGGAMFASRRWTEEEVLTMRRRWRAGEHICDLAREFGVHYHNMFQILNGQSYSWVADPA